MPETDEGARYDELLTAYTTAQDAVRANPEDADAVEQYRQAKYAFDRYRTEQAAGQTGVAFGPDMIRSEG